MPLKKHGSKKDVPQERLKNTIEPKKATSTEKKPLKVAVSAETKKPRINALATAGKKKKPKQ